MPSVPMIPEQHQLLQRIFLSRHFAYADALRRILQYLCDNASGADARPLKEYEIAVSALGRPESFDPKTDPVVRVSMASIRDRLRAYFEVEGREETMMLSVPKGRYLALFAEATAQTRAGEPAGHRPEQVALRRFWAPFGASKVPNVVMYTEPLFFRDEEAGTYTRSLYLNDRNAGLPEVKKKMPVRDGSNPRPCYHYLSAGEVQASVSFIRLFQELSLPLDMRSVRLSALNDFRSANLILLGSIRTNHFMDSMMGSKGFVMTPDCFTNPDPRPGEEKVYKGERYLDGKLPRFTEYALIVRRPGLSPGSTVTIFASNHGRAIQGGGTMLTIEPQVAALLAQMGLAEKDPVPAHFQVLLKVEMIDLDDEVVNVQYVAHRILD